MATIPRAGRFKNRNVRKGVRRIGRLQDRQTAGHLGDRGIKRLGKLQGRYEGNINRKINKLDSKIEGLGENSPKLGRFQRRRDTLQSRLAKPETSTPLQVAEDSTNPYDAEAATAQNNQINEVMAGLFPQTGNLQPEAYINQDLYDWEQQEGSKALDAYYASRGLVNSGTELEGNRRFNSELGAQIRDKAYGLAQQDADRRQGSADRLYSMLRDEADRAQRGEQNQFDNLYNTLSLMMSQSPLEQGYGASSQLADMGEGYASQLQSIMSGLVPSGGGGGGGGGYPSFQTPFPYGPSSLASDYYNSTGDYSANNGYANVVSDILGGLFLNAY